MQCADLDGTMFGGSFGGLEYDIYMWFWFIWLGSHKQGVWAQYFIMALFLFCDIVTGISWTSNGVGLLEPRELLTLMRQTDPFVIDEFYTHIAEEIEEVGN